MILAQIRFRSLSASLIRLRLLDGNISGNVQTYNVSSVEKPPRDFCTPSEMLTEESSHPAVSRAVSFLGGFVHNRDINVTVPWDRTQRITNRGYRYRYPSPMFTAKESGVPS
jgi:hypothetical protein